MASPKVLVLRSAGTNCDGETARAFELAGATPEFLHVNRLLEQPGVLESYSILAFPGGFSYGDDISAGRILAAQISSRLQEPLKRFIEKGRPVCGICNGFQVLVKTDLLPGSVSSHAGHPATLAHNTSGRFICKWVDVKEQPNSKSIWTRGVGEFSLPMAHGEGRFVPASPDVLKTLESNGQIALKYTNGSLHVGNPNGSTADIAGVSDPTGLVFGLMPHPERHLRASQHPAWTRLNLDPHAAGPGLKIFQNAVAHAKSA